MIVAIFYLIVGALIGAYNSNRIKQWAGGVAGWVRVRALGARPASARADTLLAGADAVAPAPPNVVQIAGKVCAFLWHWRGPIAALLLFCFAWGLLRPVMAFVTCPFVNAPWCVSARAEQSERVNTQVAQHETHVAVVGGELAERTHRDAARRNQIIAQANQDISDAVDQADFDRLRSAYDRAYGLVWNDLVENEPDPPPRGSSGVHRSSGNSA